MAKVNAVTKVNDLIIELTESKAAQISDIKNKIAEATSARNHAEAEMKAATERMDVEAYEAAKSALNRAATAIEMYTARYNQLQTNDYISEEESDKVIKSILDYEKEQEKEFAKAAAPIIDKLRNLLEEYAGDVQRAELVLIAWTTEIHANYRTIDGSRNVRPLPVHVVPYTGCKESITVRKFLEAMDKLS